MTHTSRTSRHALTLGGTALAAALLLTSCSGAGDAESGSGELNVVATTTQLADFAGVVGGDDISLTGLLSAGGSAHHFDPTPADLLALGEADVLIVNGAGLETFIDSALEASGFDGEIIDASTGIDLELARQITEEAGEEGHLHDHDHDEEHVHEGGDADHDHGEESHEHADADHDTEEHVHDEESHHDDHDHDHGDVNPHLWTSPRFAADMVTAIEQGLAEADPAHAADFEQRAATYKDELHELDEWIAAQFEPIPIEERLLVSGHDSLRYYLHDYDIEFVGSVLPSFEDNAEPSAAEIDELVHAIEERGVKAVFVESSMSPKLAQTIANEADVQVIDAETLYADSLGAPDSDASTYVDATAHNTRVILEAWGAEVAPLPATLDQ